MSPQELLDWNNITKGLESEPELLAMWFGKSLCADLEMIAAEEERYEDAMFLRQAQLTNAPRLINADLPISPQNELCLTDIMLTKTHFLQALRAILNWWLNDRQECNACESPNGSRHYLMMSERGQCIMTLQPEIIFDGEFRE